MTVLATFDASGFPTGYWPDFAFPLADDGSRNAAVPAAAVEISDAQWLDLSAHHGLRRMVDGAIVDYVAPAVAPPPRTQLGNVFLGAIADLGWWAWFDQGAAAQGAAAPTGAGKPLDQRYWLSVGKADLVLVSDAKLTRVAAAAEKARVAASGQPAPAVPLITMAAVMDHGDAMTAPPAAPST